MKRNIKTQIVESAYNRNWPYQKWRKRKEESMLERKMIQKRTVANWYIKTTFAEYFVHICIKCLILPQVTFNTQNQRERVWKCKRKE